MTAASAYRPVERARWIEHRVRGFVLTGTASQSTADSLALLKAPWMRAVTRSGMRLIDLT